MEFALVAFYRLMGQQTLNSSQKLAGEIVAVSRLEG